MPAPQNYFSLPLFIVFSIVIRSCSRIRHPSLLLLLFVAPCRRHRHVIFQSFYQVRSPTKILQKVIPDNWHPTSTGSNLFAFVKWWLLSTRNWDRVVQLSLQDIDYSALQKFVDHLWSHIVTFNSHNEERVLVKKESIPCKRHRTALQLSSRK